MLDCGLEMLHAWKRSGNVHPMFQIYPPNAEPARFWNETSDGNAGDQPTRGHQGQVVGSNDCSRSLAIHGGVRQGCVLSPRLLCSVLEMSMAKWRDEMKHLGLDLGDGGPSLLDFRCADDILIGRRLPCYSCTFKVTC